MLKKISLILLIISATAMLTGCNFSGIPGGSEEAPLETPSPGPSTPTLAPTLSTATPVPTVIPPTITPTAVTELAPTEIPAPTQIVPGTAAPDTTGTPAASSGPGITLNPAVGEPLDAIIVNGSGFPANAHVTLHWGPVGGPPGPVYWELDADANGAITIDLRIPPAEKWPGGSAKERDLLQLQARSEALDDDYYFANFTYVKRFNPQTSLVLTYSSKIYGYKLDVPNNWKWDDADAANVRFSAPSGNAKGFVRTLDGADVNAAIQTVMAAEVSGQTFTSTAAALGAYNGTQVTAANGLVVWFISSGGRIYALNFVDGNGQFFTIVAATFRLE
jgi:hypothetical protein